MIHTLFITFFSVLIHLSISAQTKLIVVRTSNPITQTTFYVLEDSAQTKHGPYEKVYSGTWGFTEKGQYNNGERVGLWTVFNSSTGEITQEIDFTNNRVVDSWALNPTSVFIIEDGTLRNNTTNSVPILIGHKSKFQHYALSGLRYPSKARQNGIEGTVQIIGTVTKEGHFINSQAITNLGYGLEKEALRVINSLPHDWLPLLEDGHPVDCQVTFHIKFKLPD